MQLDVVHRRTNANCIHQKENSPINNHLTLKEEPKVKSDHIKKFLAHDFQQVGVTLQTSRNMNKRVIRTFNFDYPHLTLKEGPKAQI